MISYLRSSAFIGLLLINSCGYVGDPLPPSLQIPVPITDLAAEQRAARIHLSFTLPATTTDNAGIRTFRDVEVMGGPEGAAERIPVGNAAPGPVELDVAVSSWAGKSVRFQARAQGPKGRWSEWSNSVQLQVADPSPPPANVAAKAIPEGVELTWSSSAPPYRIWRKSPTDAQPVLAATVNETRWRDDNTAYGQTYAYEIQSAGSERSAAVSITPQDAFPPPAPTNLTSVVTETSIELSWDPVSASDLAHYNVYRATGTGPFSPLATRVTAPAYSDRTAQPNVEYRYAATSADTGGNESAHSPSVSAKLP